MSIIENPDKFRSFKFEYESNDIQIGYEITNDVKCINDKSLMHSFNEVTNNINHMSVKTLIYLNNIQYEDEYGGWLKGLNKINCNKGDVASNAIVYEKYANKGKQIVGFLTCSLMLYYIETDEHFSDWYRVHTRKESDYAP